MQQRYMDPQLGVFLSADPVTAYDQPIGQFNRYRYGNGNPRKFPDPDERQAIPMPAPYILPIPAPSPGGNIQGSEDTSAGESRERGKWKANVETD
ncbi:MAG: RHS repeat-associated core domain-containing protein [Stenotrophomonas sp.]